MACRSVACSTTTSMSRCEDATYARVNAMNTCKKMNIAPERIHSCCVGDLRAVAVIVLRRCELVVTGSRRSVDQVGAGLDDPA